MPKTQGFIFVLLLTFTLGLRGQVSEFDNLVNSAYSALDDDKPTIAVDFTKEAFSLAFKRGDTYRMVVAKSTMGYIGMAVRDYESAYINYSDALSYLQKSDTVDLFNKMAILQSLALIKSKYSDYKMAAAFYKEAYETARVYVRRYPELAKQNGDLSFLVDLPYFMAMQMKNSGDYTGAGDILLNLWEESEFKGDTVSLARALNQLGIIKLANKDYLEAQNFFSYVAFNNGIEPDTRAIALQNLGASYLRLGNLEKAEKWYSEALALKIEHSSARSQFVTLLDYGELEYKKGNSTAAIEKWELALKTFDKIEAEPDLFMIYDWLQKAYLQIDITKAARYGDLYTSNIRNWMDIQRNQKDNPSLQAFNTRIDQVLSSRREKAEQLALIKEYWPLGLGVVLLLTFLLYHFQLFLTKQRRILIEKRVREVRAAKAQEILDKIRRDL
ncbi:tetratricopeptide repeat protein [Roseivirga seohaensis]|uniref:tetratricopeptide repeat protein n=1 Tax=Roseivirga seohaensis TaxID=1914963 RepID=UPI003BAD703B